MKHLLVVTATLALALVPSSALAKVVTDGCSATFLNANAEGGTVTEPGGVSYDFDTTGIELVVDDPQDWPAGTYTVTWSDGTVEHFELVYPCVEPGQESPTPENLDPGPIVVEEEAVDPDPVAPVVEIEPVVEATMRPWRIAS